MKRKEFHIPFSGLKLGKHNFTYTIDNRFFEALGYEEFNSVDINVSVELNKMSTMLELKFGAKGTVNVNCDLTSEPFEQPITANLKLVVKFGENFDDEDDEILIIPHGEHQVNIQQYLYEMLVLSVPQKRVHPGVLDGTLKSDVLDRLQKLQPKEIKKASSENDPRWDVLKQLLTDK